MSTPHPDLAPVSNDKGASKKKNWIKKPMRLERLVGRTTDLNGHIYDYSDIRQADQNSLRIAESQHLQVYRGH